jgi:L-fucose isomerase-like protein
MLIHQPGKTPNEKLIQIAKLDVVLADFMEENVLDATAIQCWTSLQKNYGCNVCTSMSMMSENMMPSACEVDVTGYAYYVCDAAGKRLSERIG